jgi:hypothetical protein
MWENPFMVDVFEHHHAYGGSWYRYLVYALATGLSTVFVLVLVGVTNILFLLTLGFLSFFAFYFFWHADNHRVRVIRGIINDPVKQQEMREQLAEDDSDVLSSATDSIVDDVGEVMDIMHQMILAIIPTLTGAWVSVIFAAIALLMPLITVATYFGLAVSSDSSGIEGVVYFAFSYYMFYTVGNLFLLAMFHMNVSFIHYHYLVEMAITIAHAVMYVVVVMVVVFDLKDMQFLYGIES